MVTLYNYGFNHVQIAYILELNLDYVRKRRDVLILQRRISEEKIEKASKNRRENEIEANDRMRNMIELEAKLNIDFINEQIQYARAKLALKEAIDTEVMLFRELLPYHEELVKLRSVRFVVDNLASKNDNMEAIRFVNECIQVTRNKEIKDKLCQVKSEIEFSIKRQQALDLIKNSKYVSYDEIARQVGISTIHLIRIVKEENANKGDSWKARI